MTTSSFQGNVQLELPCEVSCTDRSYRDSDDDEMPGDQVGDSNANSLVTGQHWQIPHWPKWQLWQLWQLVWQHWLMPYWPQWAPGQQWVGGCKWRVKGNKDILNVLPDYYGRDKQHETRVADCLECLIGWERSRDLDTGIWLVETVRSVWGTKTTWRRVIASPVCRGWEWRRE